MSNDTMTIAVGDGTVSVWHEGPDYCPDDRAYRQRYAYRITADGWEYVGNDIHSGCNAEPDVKSALATLLNFLGACAESRAYGARNGYDGENADLFPDHVGEWAETNSDEISCAAIELEEN